MNKFYVIIPSLNPDKRLIGLIDALLGAGVENILLVNDGSKEETLSFFEQAKAKGCTVLTHAVNLGKGRALKTAFNYIAAKEKDDTFAVCADADGQHLVKDILNVRDELEKSPNALVLGCRDFDDENVPKKSRHGNKITRTVFKILCGVKVSDTQTGLRGLSAATMKKYLPLKGERFEYEMNMLIEAQNLNVPIKEVSISTVYIDDNKSTHFNPLKDSLKIYSVFLKFIASSLASFLTDIVLFSILISLFKGRVDKTVMIFTATAFARICSSLVNYFINKNGVFKARNGKHTILKYYSLCIVQLLCSALIVNGMTGLFVGVNETLIKIVTDLLLFLISFRIQRGWVFKSST